MPPKIKPKNKYKNAGELRRSQAITTFGCGSIVDLPRLSGIMAGIDSWHVQLLPDDAKIHEYNLEKMLGKDFFYQVSSPETQSGRTFGVIAYRFPVWYYCPECHRLDIYYHIKRSTNSNVSENNSDLYCNKCSTGKNRVKLIPSRFVIACLNGHIDDFPYIWWVHRRRGICDNPQLFLEYKGSTGGLDSIHVSCLCGAHSTMAGCMSFDSLKGLHCNGSMPWLGINPDKKGWYKDPETCNAGLRVLQRSANNVYYPVNQNALTIPSWSAKIQSELSVREALFIDIFEGDDKDEIIESLKRHFRRNSDKYSCDEDSFIKEAFSKYACEESDEVTEKTLRNDEYKAFCGKDVDEDNVAFKTESKIVPEDFTGLISQIKLVKKLREVMVLQGFRRILPAAETDLEEREKLGLSNNDFSPISRQPKNWLPAIELFGEGIFIKFDEKAIEDWETRNSGRYTNMGNRLKQPWIGKDMFDPDSPRYILLHTFAHLLIRQLSAQCGYATASLKEKIYSTFKDTEEKMCGILIYTSATDTDGSLGGLVRQGYTDMIDSTIKSLLRESSWCSNDPICIESTSQGYMGLNYSACHACTLLPETSCESVNCLLDRASVVGTPDNPDIGFFRELL